MRIEYHEALHTVAFLIHGAKVERVEVNPGGCYPATPLADLMADLDDEERHFVALVGRYSEQFTGESDRPSDEDLSFCDFALDRAARERLFARLDSFVRKYALAIDCIADELAARPVLREPDLARLCHAPGSPLSQFAHLYAAPKSVAPAAKLKPVTTRPRPSSGVTRVAVRSGGIF